jgi:hypothetical protein
VRQIKHLTRRSQKLLLFSKLLIYLSDFCGLALSLCVLSTLFQLRENTISQLIGNLMLCELAVTLIEFYPIIVVCEMVVLGLLEQKKGE